jgi:hypothetical protein
VRLSLYLGCLLSDRCHRLKMPSILKVTDQFARITVRQHLHTIASFSACEDDEIWYFMVATGDPPPKGGKPVFGAPPPTYTVHVFEVSNMGEVSLVVALFLWRGGSFNQCSLHVLVIGCNTVATKAVCVCVVGWPSDPSRTHQRMAICTAVVCTLTPCHANRSYYMPRIATGS